MGPIPGIFTDDIHSIGISTILILDLIPILNLIPAHLDFLPLIDLIPILDLLSDSRLSFIPILIPIMKLIPGIFKYDIPGIDIYTLPILDLILILTF